MKKLATLVILLHSLTSVAVAFDVFSICTDTAYQGSPRVSGDTVVWVDSRAGSDVYGYSLSSGTEFLIGGSPSGGGNDNFLAISGNTVVWGDNRNDGAIKNYDVYGYNLSTSTEFSVTTASSSQNMVDVDNNIVTWSHYLNTSVGYDVYGKDLSTGVQFPITTEVGSTQAYPTISGDIVIWQDWRNASGNHDEGDIYGLNLSTGGEFAVSTANGRQFNQNICGDIVVWEDTRNGFSEIYGHDLLTSTEFLVSANGISPDVDGDIIAWISGDSIWTKNLLTDFEFEIATGYASLSELSISGNTVVWESNGDIYGATVPEPTTCLLLLGALPFIRRKRK